jgi:hypothetical protein
MTQSSGSFINQDFPFYTNNIWDGYVARSNVNISSGTFPNPYTAAQLYTALGYADKTAFINYAIEHPEAHIQRTARSLLFSGYGVSATSLGTLELTSSSFVTSVAKTVRILGSLPGSTISISGAPASFSVNSAARTLTYDGSTGANVGTFTLTENGHNTTVSYIVGVATATLNPSDKSSANLVLSNGNLTTATTGTAIEAVRATRGVPLGTAVYWEGSPNAFVDSNIFGVANLTQVLTTQSYWALTASANAAGWFTTTLRYNGTTKTTTPPVGTRRFAISASGKFYVGDITGWLGGGDPATDTGGLSITGLGSTFYPAWQGDSGDKATMNFGDRLYDYTPPAGFGNV